jgi:hypothetical protein
MADDRRKAIIPGAILILLGAILLAAEFLPGLGLEDFAVLAIGIVFLVAFLLQRQYGFLVPAGILTGLGLGIVAEQWFGGDLTVLGLGLGFIAIWVLDRLVTRASTWWPLIPGGILVVVGITAAFPWLAPLVGRLWPVAIVAVGVVLVVLALARRGE